MLRCLTIAIVSLTASGPRVSAPMIITGTILPTMSMTALAHEAPGGAFVDVEAITAHMPGAGAVRDTIYVPSGGDLAVVFADGRIDAKITGGAQWLAAASQ